MSKKRSPAAERQAKRRKLLKIAEVINVRLHIPSNVHTRIKKRALINEMTLHAYIIACCQRGLEC